MRKKRVRIKEPPLAGIQKRTGREPMVFGWLLDFFKQKLRTRVIFQNQFFEFWEPWLWTLGRTGLMTGWRVGAISNTHPTVVLTEGGQLLWVSIWHTPIQPITTSQLGNTQILHYTCKIGYAYLIRVVCSATSGLGYEATTLKCTPATLESEQLSPSSGLYMD